MLITGANLFHQWLVRDKILCEIQAISEKFNKEKVEHTNVICISWSYNILKIADKLFLSGSWRGIDGQFITLPLPDNNIESSSLLISCNDYKIVMVDKSSSILWLLDLKTEHFQRICFIERPHCNSSSNELQLSDNIIQVKVTGDSCAFLTKEGNVFVGFLPCHVDTGHCIGKVCHIECGYEHFVLLTDNGSVYTWGNGRRLQLGHGGLENTDSPTEVKALAGIKIVKISANGWHTLALSESGDLYCWGWNDTGQLGIKFEDDDNFTGVPILVTIYDEHSIEVELNVTDIACGTRHSVILLEDNSVWTTGCNKHGQLGFPLNVIKSGTYKKCFDAAPGSKLLCGPWCTVIKPLAK